MVDAPNPPYLGPPAHYSAGSNKPIHRVVIHATVSPCKKGEARNTAAYFRSQSAGGSAHYVVDPGEVVQSAYDGVIAWHAPPNGNSLGIELCDPMTGPGGRWHDTSHVAMLRLAARLTAQLCLAYDVPIHRIDVADLKAGRKGICGHADVSDAWHQSCVTADTPILCRDLTWKPAGDLIPGDEIIAFDEDSPNQEGRRFRNSFVVNNELKRDALLAVHTKYGTVRCNYDHPWLTREVARRGKWGKWAWKQASDLKPGDEVMRLFDPWEVDRSWDSGWLAGMYDGEGWFYAHDPAANPRQGHSLSLGVCQRESATSDRLQSVLKEYTGYLSVRRLVKDRQPLFQFVVNRRSEAMRLLGMVRPPRLLAKAGDFWVGGSLGKSCERVTIDSIEGAGTGVIASLTTSSRTYIADGYAMHNTHWDPGDAFPWPVFMGMVRHAAVDLSGRSVPAPTPVETRKETAKPTRVTKARRMLRRALKGEDPTHVRYDQIKAAIADLPKR